MYTEEQYLKDQIEKELNRIGTVLMHTVSPRIEVRGDTVIRTLFKGTCTMIQCGHVEFDMDYTMLSNDVLNKILTYLKNQ